MSEQFLTARQVSTEIFNGAWNYQKILRLTRNGILPAVKAGKSYLYQRGALEHWVETNFTKPAWSKIKIG